MGGKLMEDKDLMENHLLVVKGICDLYLHGTLESTTAEVHTAFKDALMKARNWYSTEEAEATKIASAKQKYSN